MNRGIHAFCANCSLIVCCLPPVLGPFHFERFIWNTSILVIYSWWILRMLISWSWYLVPNFLNSQTSLTNIAVNLILELLELFSFFFPFLSMGSSINQQPQFSCGMFPTSRLIRVLKVFLKVKFKIISSWIYWFSVKMTEQKCFTSLRQHSTLEIAYLVLLFASERLWFSFIV